MMCEKSISIWEFSIIVDDDTDQSDIEYINRAISRLVKKFKKYQAGYFGQESEIKDGE